MPFFRDYRYVSKPFTGGLKGISLVSNKHNRRQTMKGQPTDLSTLAIGSKHVHHLDARFQNLLLHAHVHIVWGLLVNGCIPAIVTRSPSWPKHGTQYRLLLKSYIYQSYIIITSIPKITYTLLLSTLIMIYTVECLLRLSTLQEIMMLQSDKRVVSQSLSL